MTLTGKHILVVEDDPVLRKFIHDVLVRKKAQVETAENGVQALEKMEKGAFHLILSDLRMKEMDGLELLARVKQSKMDTEFILMTAYGSISSAVEAMRKGAFDYITKPIELEELDIVIRRVFQHQELVRENRYLKSELDKNVICGEIIGKSRAVLRAKELVEIVGPLDSTVLIMGETGTGKEVVANAIQRISSRKNNPYIKVNCAAIPETLLESELFGYEKGAFTGATQRSKGRFELANDGTLLLDEIGELAMPLQAKLLRVLQYQEFERVGSGQTLKVDVRVIATTNRDLKEEVRCGKFRKDLFFRLNVVTVPMVPLRERRKDIPFFLEHFLRKFNTKYGREKRFSEKTLERLMEYDWPGNVRELENCIETAVILTSGDDLKPEHFVFLEENRDLLFEDNGASDDMTLAESEKRIILKTYRSMNQNKTRTARKLGITVKTLRSKLRKYDLISEDTG